MTWTSQNCLYLLSSRWRLRYLPRMHHRWSPNKMDCGSEWRMHCLVRECWYVNAKCSWMASWSHPTPNTTWSRTQNTISSPFCHWCCTSSSINSSTCSTWGWLSPNSSTSWKLVHIHNQYCVGFLIDYLGPLLMVVTLSVAKEAYDDV